MATDAHEATSQLVASLRPHKQRGVHLRLSTLRHGCLVSLRRAPPAGAASDGPDTRHIDVAADWSSDLESTLVRLLALDAERARQLVGQGAVWVAGARAADPAMAVPPAAYLRVHLRPKAVAAMPLEIRAVCGARHADFVICAKPAGVPTHAAMDNASQNALSALSAQLGVRLLPTSRLDVPTSGLLCFARTAAFQSHFNAALRERRVEKEYTALVMPGTAPLGAEFPRRLVHWMERDGRAPKRLFAEPCGDAQRCESVLLSARRVRARVRGSGGGGVELLEVRLKLETGRTHQLRAQLAFEGCPIVGDDLYGSPSLEALAADAAAGGEEGDDLVVLPTVPIALHACRLGFPALEGGAWQEFELEPGWRVEDEKPTTLLSLPEELVRHILCCASRGAVCSAGRACKQLAALAADDAVWRALYERRWSHQLIEPEGIDRRLWNVDPPLPMDMPKTHRELFHCRLTNGVYLRVVEGVHYFTGTAADQYDGNVTPISASIGMKGMQLTGHVRYGSGTLHNSPTTAIWLGTIGKHDDSEFAEDKRWNPRWDFVVARQNSNRREVEWREVSRGSRMIWIYQGHIDEAGTTIRGSFHLNIMPRKCGTFELRLREAEDSDPTTLGDLCRLVFSGLPAHAGGLPGGSAEIE